MQENKKAVRTLIVDDSAVVREVMKDLLAGDPEISVMGAAPNPFIAAEKIAEEVPDVIILDIEMPKMDGLTFLGKIMAQHPIPVVICSSLVGNCETSMRALELGAVEIITKPQIGTRQFLEESRIRICDIVKAASCAKLQNQKSRERLKKNTADVIIPKANVATLQTTEKLIIVGASTGGTEALRVFLEDMPLDCPAIVIVQHMPEKFTACFAARLNDICRISVREAAYGDTLLRGQALIAPGNHHLLVKSSGARYFVETRDGPLVSRHRPSVDVLFRSAARYAGKNAVGVIMTGMCDDGARGLLELREAGARTIAQDEQTSVVFGMPNEAIKRGAAEKILPLDRIAREVLQLCRN
jgi:two-component system chemotaxis response regulator CheB